MTLVGYDKQLIKKQVYFLSQKFIYASKIIDLVIHIFIPNDESSHFQICDHSMVEFGIREKYLGLSNTSHTYIFTGLKEQL